MNVVMGGQQTMVVSNDGDRKMTGDCGGPQVILLEDGCGSW